MKKNETVKNIAVIGLGLLGSSLLLALAGNPKYRRFGWSRNPESIAWAQESMAVDEAIYDLKTVLARADIVVLAMPIPAIIAFLEEHKNHFKAGSVVTDIGSTKQQIMKCAAKYKINFVGSHPMAGTEKSGCLHAFAELYRNAEVFICRGNASEKDVNTVKLLWSELDTRTVEIDPAEHDNLVANTSHVLHIIASALALSILGAEDPEERERRFSGCATGFRDTSRIASSNPVMWREIIESNREAVLAAMAGFDSQYNELRRMIIEGDFDGFEQKFDAGRRLRNQWVEYKNHGGK